MAQLEAAIIPVTPFAQNCALLWDAESRRGAVVDPGGEVGKILAEIGRRQVSIEKILLTHGHIDHAGGAAELRELLGKRAGSGDAPPIEGPDPRDAFLLQGLATQGRMFGIADARPVEPDRWLADGDEVTVGGHAFAVRHCPGHTPGHVVFISRSVPFAILGDVLFRGSIGRTDFPYGDHAALLQAIEAKLLPLPDEVEFLCGHGPGSTIGAERRSNPFLRR
jgi:glyoxylase-like metal-dependent hydrolase (beta-lactamase superfamily II)